MGAVKSIIKGLDMMCLTQWGLKYVQNFTDDISWMKSEAIHFTEIFPVHNKSAFI